MIMKLSTDVLLIMPTWMRCLDYHVTQPLLGEEEIVCQVSHLDKLPVCAKEIATEPNIAIKSAGPNFVGMAQSFHR